MFYKLNNTMALQCCLLVTIVIIFASQTYGVSNHVCSTGINTAGITVPRGDIIIEYENPLEIYCVLNDEYVEKYGPNISQNLRFYRFSEKLPDDMIEVINASTTRLYVKKPPLSNDSYYYCKLEKEGTSTLVCLNIVAVGTKPQNVTDFKCIGQNYDNLTCSWTAPRNYVKTTYSLSYHFAGRSSRVTYHCPNNNFETSEGPMQCFWDIRTEPHYRQAQPVYYFNLTMNNTFGTNSISKHFAHFHHVIPGPPDNLTLVSTTHNSITVRWSVPTSMLNFPPGLMHRVLYQSEYENRDEWQLADVIFPKTKQLEYKLRDLKYAHAHYDIRVSMRSKEANFNDESLWSKNSSLVITTASAEPGAPPRTNIGSFETINLPNHKREVYIYWQQIPMQMENGQNFSYDVKTHAIADNVNHTIAPNEMTAAYARFKDLNATIGYRFVIESRNEIGSSINKSYVYVPSRIDRIAEPTSFTKIAFNGGVYELSWDPPTDRNVSKYTIFWCSNERDRPYQCKGQLNWTEVDRNVHIKNITLPETKIYQFAIAANSETSSSGMVWAACTVIHNKSFGKMKSVWISKIGSNFIEVGWKLECSDRIGSVEGFIIYYCPIVSPTEASCKGPQQNVTISGDPLIMHANASRLNPYTTYMLTVSVITKHDTKSQPSEPMFNTTLEAAPESYPNNLEVTNITNTSMTVRWAAPTAKNGLIRYYIVHYNDMIKKVDSHSGTDNETEIVLTDLDSYQNYNVTVVACTVACSEPAPYKAVQTLIGVPGQMNKPYVNTKNETYIKIEWKPPSKGGGEIDRYELRISVHDENNTKTVSTNETSFKFDDCKDNGHKTYYFAVRALNIYNNHSFEGPWSEENEHYCRQSSDVIIWVGLVLIIGLVVYFCYWLCSRLITCYNEVKDVDATLPAGLSTLEPLDHHHWDRSPGEAPIQHMITETDLDRGPLLQKSEKGLMGSRDSSGCSSGNPSVTSSLDSEPHLSAMSDSGTEQTRSPSLDDPSSRKNSLRRRQASQANKGYVPMPTADLNSSNLWGTKLNAGGNYCVIGVNQNPSDGNVTPGYTVEPVKKPKSAGDSSYLPVSHFTTKPAVDNTNTSTPYMKAGSEAFLGLLSPSARDLMTLEPINLKTDTDEAIVENTKPPYVQVANVADVVAPNYIKTGDILGLKDASGDCGYLTCPPASGGLAKGYVALGEVHTERPHEDVSSKGYVPHRQFDGKTLKED